MNDNKKQIQSLIEALEEKLDWGPVKDWHSSMFDELSDTIFSVTQTKLSSTTLKRFFGIVNHKGNPSISTLDALSSFVGSENWRDFKMGLSNTNGRIKTHVPRKSIYISLGFLLSIFLISILSNKQPEIIINADEIPFSSRVLSTEYPNSVVFDFTLPPTKADSFVIQQYWDRSKTVQIQKNQSQATGIYYFPGYFKAKLLFDQHLIKEHDLFLKSNGWLGTLEFEPVPKYFEPIVEPGLDLSYPDELKVRVSDSDKPLKMVYHFIDDLGDVSADNFSFSAILHHTYNERWAVCQTTQVYFIGTNGEMVIPFSKLGCVSDINLMLNDVYLSGKENDLSALSIDFATAKKVEISVKNQVVRISSEGRDLFSKSYNSTMGQLVGMRIKYLGLGNATDIQVRDHQDQVIPFN